jgi:hypothetical protein
MGWRPSGRWPSSTTFLAKAGAVPRVYTLSTGGNDGEAWLVDPRIVVAIAESGLFKESGAPALATHE